MVALLRVATNLYVIHPKYSQDFESVERNQGMNHEKILKYQVRPFDHTGIHSIVGWLVNSPSTRCRLGYHGVLLIASPFLH